MAITREQAAARTGAFAARRGLPITVCPHDKNDPETGHLAHLWVAAYLAHKPPRPGDVDYSADEPDGDITHVPQPITMQVAPTNP